MIRLNSLSYHLPQGYLYKDISLFVDRGDKIGLTGKNGAGKSTLLGIFSGKIKPSEGNVSTDKGITIGYLTQDLQVTKESTVRNYLLESNDEIKQLQERLNFVNHELSTRTDYESEEYSQLIVDVSDLNERLNILGAFNLEEKVEIVLKGLGFKQEQFDNPLSSFSGGWQMRAELAKILVNEPDVLLIDEPTNHLDIVSIQWLEDYLIAYNGAVVLISHDRRFLDNVTNRTVEIANQRLYDYKCNYSKYLVLHEEELDRTMRAKKNQDREIKRMEDLANKYRAKANKAAFAQSLLKKIDKMDKIELDSIDRKAFNLKFTVEVASGKRVLSFHNVGKKYGDNYIFKGLDALLNRGEKIALLGPNGVGKSTLLKSITKDIDYEGEIEYGHNVSIGYFAQDAADSLDLDKTVFETIDAIAIGDKRKDIRSILGAFLFGGEAIDKKVKVLSGGERTRLAICKLLFHDYNVLVLDEPTNHLDIQSKEILKDALIQYEGTLLIVSHDRDFLDGLSNKIWEITPDAIRTHYFGVNEFLKRINYAENEKKENKGGNKNGKAANAYKDQNQLKSLENKVKKCEQNISDLEGEVEVLTKKLENAANSQDENYDKLLEQFNQKNEALEKAMSDWEEASMELEEFNA